MRLTFKGTRWLWYLLALGILIAQALLLLNVAQPYILPLTFVLPLTFWWDLGVREVKHRAEQIIFSAPHPLTRQLPITWLTGVFLILIITHFFVLPWQGSGQQLEDCYQAFSLSPLYRSFSSC